MCFANAGYPTLRVASVGRDNVGNRTAKTDKPANTTYNFSYDNIYQLTQVTQGAATPESYTYSAVGNRLASVGGTSYNYNSSNHLTTSTGATYTYDNNGNVISKTDLSGTTAYSWNLENQLTSVTLPNAGGIVSFTYDPFGRRIRKIFGASTTIYVYDEENVIEEVDGSGGVLARYVQGLSVDEPLLVRQNSATYYYQVDGLGSITSITDSSGSTAATYSYDSFGNTTNSTGTITNAIRYASKGTRFGDRVVLQSLTLLRSFGWSFSQRRPSKFFGEFQLFHLRGQQPG